MRVLFFPCTLDGLAKHSGSRLIRCEWVAKYWEEAEVYDGTQRLRDFQLFVFQKAYLGHTSQKLIRQLARWRDEGRPIALAFDLCDPDFLGPHYLRVLMELLPLFDFATAPTTPLVEWLAQWLPAYEIPDGVDTEAITVHHEFRETRNPSIVWMGYKGNAGALLEISQTMQDEGLTGDTVTVSSPMPFEAFVAQMAEYDILLNPRPPRPPFLYKSDNKTLVAWAAGVAVACDGPELRQLLLPKFRREHLALGRGYVERGGHVRESVMAWQDVVRQEMEL